MAEELSFRVNEEEVSEGVVKEALEEGGERSRRWRVEAVLPELGEGENRVSVAWGPGGGLGEKSVVVSTSGEFRVLRHFAYPNPFSEGVEVFYQVTEGVREARLKIYTVSGRRVRTLVQADPEADLNRIGWDGRDGDGDRVANGVYLYRLELVGPDGKRTAHEGKIARVVGHVDG
jgi:hypothetical protein